MFGFQVPNGVEPRMYWGARAIIQKADWGYKSVKQKGKYIRRYVCLYPQSLDFLPDRQTMRGVTDQPDKDEFFRWLNKVALPKLKKWAETVDPTGHEVFEFQSDGYILMASPQGSYGYLYIGGWPVTGQGEPHSTGSVTDNSRNVQKEGMVATA